MFRLNLSWLDRILPPWLLSYSQAALFPSASHEIPAWPCLFCPWGICEILSRISKISPLNFNHGLFPQKSLKRSILILPIRSKRTLHSEDHHGSSSWCPSKMYLKQSRNNIKPGYSVQYLILFIIQKCRWRWTYVGFVEEVAISLFLLGTQHVQMLFINFFLLMLTQWFGQIIPGIFLQDFPCFLIC